MPCYRVIFALFTVLTLASPFQHLPAAAGEPAVQAIAVDGGARLTVGGKLVAMFRTPNGNLSPDQRASKAADRLRKLIEAGLKPSEIEVKSTGSNWGVFAAGGLVMVATQDEAAARDGDAEALARKWAGNLKAALAANGVAPTKRPDRDGDHPPAKPTGKGNAGKSARPGGGTLAASDDSLVVPVGETRTIGLKGSASGGVSVRVESPEVASAQAVPGKAAVEVRGLASGKAVVRVQRGGVETAFTVWVKKYAGRLAEVPTALVTGRLTPGSFVRRVAKEKLLEGIRTEPGAKIEINGELQGLQALAQGDSTTVSLPLSITGAGCLPVKTEARVQVRNIALPPQECSSLLYSNDPESIREYGILYEGMVESSGTARLFYHHQNRMGRPFVFQIHVLNPNRTPVDVQIMPADAGPILDTIQVGHGAGKRYMEMLMQDIGYISTIPPRESRTLYSVAVPDRLTVSGIYNVRVIKGGSLVVHVSAEQDVDRPEVTDELVDAARAEPDTYANPHREESYRYEVGKPWLFVPVGKPPLQAHDPNRRLFGNYGVLYTFKFVMENGTDSAANVKLMFAPGGDWARGVFVVDGKLVEAKQAAPPIEVQLWADRLAPNERRELTVQALPIGGSSYPVSLVVRP